MQSLLTKISDEIEFKRMSRRKIAKNIKIGHTTISHFLNGKDEMKFNNYGQLIREVFPNDKDVSTRRDLCFEYFSKTSREINRRLAMDYLSVHGELDLLKKIIDHEKDSDEEVNKEWAEIYELLYLRSKESLTGEELFEALLEKKNIITTTEMNILSEIISLFIEYDKGNFKTMTSNAFSLINKLGAVKNPYIRASFEYKIKECIFQGLLLSDEIEKARECCWGIINEEKVIKQFPMIVATAYGVLGESYTFESPEKAIRYVKKAIKILEKELNDCLRMRKEKMNNTIIFLKIHWKIDLLSITPVHLNEKIYLNIQLGKSDIAIQELEKIKKEKGNLNAYELYLLGLAKNDKNILVQSLEKFEKVGGNFFYSKLVKIKLGIL